MMQLQLRDDDGQEESRCIGCPRITGRAVTVSPCVRLTDGKNQAKSFPLTPSTKMRVHIPSDIWIRSPFLYAQTFISRLLLMFSPPSCGHREALVCVSRWSKRLAAEEEMAISCACFAS